MAPEALSSVTQQPIYDTYRSTQKKPPPTQPPPVVNSSAMSSLENRTIPSLFSGVGGGGET